MTKQQNKKRQILNLIELCVGIIAIIICITLIIIISSISRPVRISGNSMENTLHNGQWVNINLTNKKIEKGVILVYTKPGDKKWVIKRVIATEGDKVEILSNGSVFITLKGSNDRKLYQSKTHVDGHFQARSYIINKNQFFAMGDNRKNSIDSREYGPVHQENVIGSINNSKKDIFQISTLS